MISRSRVDTPTVCVAVGSATALGAKNVRPEIAGVFGFESATLAATACPTLALGYAAARRAVHPRAAGPERSHALRRE